MKFAVIGCGSIGERHIYNLKALNIDEIIAYDINFTRLIEIKKKYNIEICTDFNEVLTKKFDAFIICTPPTLHVSFTLEAISRGIHVFIEKPISHNLDRVDELIKKAEEKKIVNFVGYNLRFHPGLILVRSMLTEGEIGKILSATVEFGQYLPDWRPRQDYRQSYTAKKNLGGGIILDASHEIDYILWLLGEVKEVFCLSSKISSLEVDTEDSAEILLKFEGNVIVHLHLDFLQRVYSRSCKLIGEEGIIIWDYPQMIVKIYSIKNKKWRTFNIECDPNEMYLKEMKHFIECILGREKSLINVRDAKRTLEIVLAAKSSSQKKRVVTV